MRFLKSIWHRLTHKIEHFKLSSLTDMLKKHGLAFLVIFIVWEIIEDILFPVIIILLGKYVNPWSYSGAPVSWLLCLHPIAVPVLWAAWVKYAGNKNSEQTESD